MQFNHHNSTLENIRKKYHDNENILAIIVAGSVARESAHEFSDIDAYIVVNDEEYNRRKQAKDLFIVDTDVSTYDKGYLDGKVINMDFMYQAAQRGSEPCRYSFINAFPLFSKVEGMEKLIRSISIYPENLREQKIASFYSQIMLYTGYFVNQAEKNDNTFLKVYSCFNAVLFSYRLILAINRMLFPCYKTLVEEVKKAKRRPQRIFDICEKALKYPSAQSAEQIKKCMCEFYPVKIGPCAEITNFLQDVEWNWIEGKPSIQDW